MSTSPIRFDRVQAGLVASVVAALPSAVVVWAGQAIPDGIASDTLAVLSIVSGFDTSPRGGESRPVRTLPLTATLQITAPARVWISGMWWEADDRDDLLAQLDAEPLVSATHEAAGASGVEVAGLAPGDLHSLAAQPAAAATWTVDSSALAEVLVESVSGVCSLDLYSRTRSIRLGAMAAIHNWRSSVLTTPGQELLDRYGLALGGDPIRVLSLDAIAGPRWGSRARATFPTTTQAVDATTTIPEIETVEAALELRGVDPAATATIEIP